MFRYQNDRSEFTSIAKPAGVKRVVCVGDSLVYSQGVHNHETLTAQLETFLNQAHWAEHIEVINAGRCGASIYDDFGYYQCRCLDLNADLVVLVLVDNDAEFIGTQVDYSKHLSRMWKTDSAEKKMIGPMIGKIGRYFKQANIPFMVAFSDIYAAETAAVAQETISNACKEHDIKYLDISAQFQGTNTVASNDSLTVSPADGHPSALGLSIITKTLARKILKEGILKDSANHGRSEAELYAQIFDDTYFYILNGCRPDAFVLRAKKTIETKFSCRARSRQSKELLLTDIEVQELIQHLNGIAAKCVDLEHLLACYEHVSQLNPSQINDARYLVEDYSCRLIRELFLASQAYNNPDLQLSLTDDLLIAPGDPGNDTDESSAKMQHNWRKMSQLLRTKICLETETTEEASNFLQRVQTEGTTNTKLENLVSSYLIEVAEKLSGHVNASAQLLRTMTYCTDELIFFLESHEQSLHQQNGWNIAFRQFLECFKLTKSIATVVSDSRFGEMPVTPIQECEQPLIKISVSSCSNSTQPQWLEITVNPLAKDMTPYRMNHNVVLDGKWRTYDFSVPLTHLFDMQIEAWPMRDLELGNSVRISYWTGESIEFNLEHAEIYKSSREGGQVWSARGLSMFLLRQAA